MAGLLQPGAYAPAVVLLRFDVRGGRTLLALLDVKRDALAFGQRLEAATLDGAVVDEDVLGAIGRGNKAKAFFVAKPLHCTCSHFGYLCLFIVDWDFEEERLKGNRTTVGLDRDSLRSRAGPVLRICTSIFLGVAWCNMEPVTVTSQPLSS